MEERGYKETEPGVWFNPGPQTTCPTTLIDYYAIEKSKRSGDYASLCRQVDAINTLSTANALEEIILLLSQASSGAGAHDPGTMRELISQFGCFNKISMTLSNKIAAGPSENNLDDVDKSLNILRTQRFGEQERDGINSFIDALSDLRSSIIAISEDKHIYGDVHGQNQQFNAGGGNQQNNKTVKTAMIEYDNKLLNNPGLLSAGSQVYGIKKTLDAVLRFDDRMISEIVQNNDEDLLLAGILSFEDYA
jgi:hypothetical protein